MKIKPTHFLKLKGQPQWEFVSLRPETEDSDPTVFEWIDELGHLVYITYAAVQDDNVRIVELHERLMLIVPSMKLCVEGQTIWELVELLYDNYPKLTAELSVADKVFYTVNQRVKYNRVTGEFSQREKSDSRFLMTIRMRNRGIVHSMSVIDEETPVVESEQDESAPSANSHAKNASDFFEQAAQTTGPETERTENSMTGKLFAPYAHAAETERTENHGSEKVSAQGERT